MPATLLFGTMMIFQGLPPVLGYIDPGTGSYILQLLIGGFLGFLFALKLYWRRLKGAVARLVSGGGAGGDEG